MCGQETGSGDRQSIEKQKQQEKESAGIPFCVKRSANGLSVQKLRQQNPVRFLRAVHHAVFHQFLIADDGHKYVLRQQGFEIQLVPLKGPEIYIACAFPDAFQKHFHINACFYPHV